MITIEQYFGNKVHSQEQEANAVELLDSVNALLDEAEKFGAYAGWPCPHTGTQISGCHGGAGDGGFRLPDTTTGRPLSSHKEAKGIDVFDPDGSLDMWITRKVLEKFNLYREHPDYTKDGWCHLTKRPPKSGCRTFIP